MGFGIAEKKCERYICDGYGNDAGDRGVESVGRLYGKRHIP